MGQVIVDPRVHQRHPEIGDEDAIAAWNGAICCAPRLQRSFSEYAAVGFDRRGRFIEVIATRTIGGDWLIYHAMTPPTKKMLRELGIERSGHDIRG